MLRLGVHVCLRFWVLCECVSAPTHTHIAYTARSRCPLFRSVVVSQYRCGCVTVWLCACAIPNSIRAVVRVCASSSLLFSAFGHSFLIIKTSYRRRLTHVPPCFCSSFQWFELNRFIYFKLKVIQKLGAFKTERVNIYQQIWKKQFSPLWKRCDK